VSNTAAYAHKPAGARLSSGLNVKFGGTKTNAWGTAKGGGGGGGGGGKKGGDVEGPAITSKDVGTATKAEAAYKKQLRAQEVAAAGGDGNSKKNKKKQAQELRAMAFM
jgi:hypothetical protein